MPRQKLIPNPRSNLRLAALLFGLLVVPVGAIALFAVSRLSTQRPSGQSAEARFLIGQGIEQLQHGLETTNLEVMDAATQTFQKAAASAQEHNDREAEALAQVSLGNVYVSMLNSEGASKACQRSLELYQASAHSSGEALSQICLGGAYASLGELETATEAFQKALALYQHLHHSYGEAATYLALGSIHLATVQPQQAREAFQQSLNLYQRLGNPAGEAYAVLNVGGSYLIQQEFEQAISFYEQAREQFRQLGQPAGEIMTLVAMGMAYGFANQPHKVIEVFEEIQKMLAQGNTSLEASAENLLAAGAKQGITLLLLEQYERISNRTQPLETKSLQKTAPASQEVVASPEGVGSAEFVNYLGRAYGMTGQYQKAIDAFQEALEIYKTTNNRFGEAEAARNLAQVYYFVGQYWRSSQRFEQAETLFRELERPYYRAWSLYNLGQAQWIVSQQEDDRTTQKKAIAQDDDDRTVEEKAIESLKESLEIFQTLDKSFEEAMVLSVLGSVYVLQGRDREGIRSIQQALDIARKRGDRIAEVSATNNLGVAYLAQGHYPQAIASFREALQISQTLQNPDARLDPASLSGALGIALFQAGQLDEAEQSLRESIRLWRLQRQPLNDLNKVSLFEIQLQHLYDLLQRILIAKGNPEAALEIAEEGRARAFLELLAMRWHPAEDAPPQLEAPNLSQIRRIARSRNATLVTYSLARDFEVGTGWPLREATLLIWVVQPTGELTLRQVDLKTLKISLKDLIADTRQHMVGENSLLSPVDDLAFQSGNLVRLKTDPPSYKPRRVIAFDPETKIAKVRFAYNPNAPIQAVPEHELERAIPIKLGLQQLHRLLIEPIADALPTDPEAQVVFVPHQDLFLVPFAALQDAERQFLIEKHTLLTVPAIQVLAETRKRRKILLGKRKDVLVVGNPRPMPEKLPKLSGAQAEAKAIASVLKTKPILGRRATEATIKAQMLDARAIHLATHGTFNDREPLRGFVALAPTEEEDGLLTAEEIYNLDNQLTAELVVLSGCDTGRGQINGDGVVGLARSWFAAGVPSAIVSLWKVPDRATADLMTAFYRHWQQGDDKAQALRQAMLTTMKKHPDPSNWAAFTLIGEAE